MRASDFRAAPSALSVACVLASIHALLFALAFPPFDFWFLAPLIPAPLALLAVGVRSARTAVVVTIAVQFVMWLWMLRWIIPVTAIGYPALALYLAVFGGVFAWLFRRIADHKVVGRWPMMVTLPIVWTGIEFFRGDVLFYGYPWYLIGHPLIAWPMVVQSADLFGTYFISFQCAMISGFVLDVAHRRLRLRTDSNPVSYPGVLYPFIALAALLTMNTVYGAWRMNQTAPLRPGPRVLAIQTNLPQDNKTGWPLKEQVSDFISFAEQTIEAVNEVRRAGERIDLVAWPETMLPGFGLEPQAVEFLAGHDYHARDFFARGIRELHAQIDVPLLIGSETWLNLDVVDDRFTATTRYNSAYLITGEPPFQRYDKYFLTPFGETMPYISAWPWLERQLLTLGVGADLAFNLDSNPDVRLLRLDHESSAPHVFIATPICFEDTVGRYCRRMIHQNGVKRGDAFVNISNDGWFNKSIADRKLHAQIARFRCIENRVPMIRSVNTGMSVAIDSRGKLVAAIGDGGYGAAQQPGWVAADLMLDSRRTLYGRIGELWPWTCLVLTLFAAIVTIVRRPDANATAKSVKSNHRPE